MISFTKEQFEKLETLESSRKVICSESKILKYQPGLIIKSFYSEDIPYLQNKIYTYSLLNKIKRMISDDFCIPQDLVYVDEEFKGLLLSKVKGDNLSIKLDSDDLSFEEKKLLLMRLGDVLRKIEKKPLFIGDLHPDNCIVDNDNKITIIDMDSCKIGHNDSSISKYLAISGFIDEIEEKYSKAPNNSSIVNIDNNTDLFCYCMIIFDFLFSAHPSLFTVKRFSTYIDYLEFLEFDPNIIEAFRNLASNTKNNINPVEYIDSITEEQFKKCKTFRFIK